LDSAAESELASDTELTIGFDGKYLWQGMSFGSRSGHGVHAKRLLREMLECWPRGRFKVYALDPEVDIDYGANCQVVTLPLREELIPP
jgi:hypothetical protein